MGQEVRKQFASLILLCREMRLKIRSLPSETGNLALLIDWHNKVIKPLVDLDEEAEKILSHYDKRSKNKKGEES